MLFNSLKLVATALLFILIACNNGKDNSDQTIKDSVSVISNTTNTDTCNSIRILHKGYTNDFISLFTQKQIIALDSIISNNEKKTTNEIFIVTLDSLMLGNCSLEEYAINLGNKWGIGKKKKNNGIMIAICPQLRKITIRTGFGIEQILLDEVVQSIIDDTIIPYYKKNNYFEGTKAGLLAIIEKTRL
jgi:uncharacterized protein